MSIAKTPLVSGLRSAYFAARTEEPPGKSPMIDRTALRLAYRPDENAIVKERLDQARLSASQQGEASAIALDPNGAQALRAAKRLRRKELGLGTLGSPSRLLELAEDRFGVRPERASAWTQSEVLKPWDQRNGVHHAPASGPMATLAGE